MVLAIGRILLEEEEAEPRDRVPEYEIMNVQREQADR